MELPPLKLDGTDAYLEIDPFEIRLFYLPLADFIIDKACDHTRYIIGIAGPPASGKTALVQILGAILNSRLGQDRAAVVGLDGWHFPSSYLNVNYTIRSGEQIPLRRVKGAPETFDLNSALQFLKNVKMGKVEAVPVYTRKLHEPTASGMFITTRQQIVLMEGNYLLLNLPGWDNFRSLFDLTIFIDAPMSELITALHLRHARGGKSSTQIENHLAITDLPNISLVRNHSFRADIRIEKKDFRRILKVNYP